MREPTDTIQPRPNGGPPTDLQGDISPSTLPAGLWRLVLERLPTGIAILNDPGVSTSWVNSAMESLVLEGTGATNIIGCAPFDYLPGLNADEWAEAMHQARAATDLRSRPRKLQFVHHATRNIAYWEWTLQWVEEGEARAYFILTVQAISDRVLNERVLASAGRAADRARRRAEALMRLTQVVNASLTTPELLRAITHQAAAYFDSSHAAVLLLDKNGADLSVGYAIGLEQADPPAHPPLDLNNTLAGRAIAQRQTQILTEAENAPIITPRIEGGAAPTGLISSPIWQGGRDYGAIEVYFPDARDVTEHARATLAAFADQTAIALNRADLYEQLTAQRRQLQSIVENAPVNIIYFDVEGTALLVNDAAASRYGLDVSEMEGHSYLDFLEDLPPGLFEGARAGKPFHASHHVHRTSPSAQVVCDLSLVPVRNETGAVVGVLLLSFEVTDLVKARQEADQAREQAEIALANQQATQRQMVQMEKMRAVGELASGVAHDFNNALMAILGYTELAEDNLDSPKELASQLAIIRTAAEDASTTVERLQQFAKQRVKSHGEPIDMNAIVKDVIDLTRPRWRDAAQKRGIVYNVSTTLEPIAPIFAEPSGLREILVNLMHNSLNAMPEGGALTVTTRMFDPGHVEVCVSDTGVGMTPETAARIFDPFFTTRGVEGTGLGLAVSWTIIQRYGGVIDLDTEPGRGTNFMLRFPICDEAAPPDPVVPAHGSSMRSNGARALVVDDEPFVASVLATILTRRGFRVAAVHSGQAALDCLEHAGDDPFEVILTDHGMPGITGLELVARVKARWPSLPILLLTGWGESVLQTHVTEVLPDAVLGKPINQSDLIDSIGRVMNVECPGPS